MKHRTIILLALCVALSLACLAPVASMPTGAPAVMSSPDAVITAVATSAPVSEPAVHEKTTGQFCAKVTAVKALTLRAADGVDNSPVGWLLAGDIVHLVGPPEGDWWPVDIDGRVGWARSSYLEKVECVP